MFLQAPNIGIQDKSAQDLIRSKGGPVFNHGAMGITAYRSLGILGRFHRFNFRSLIKPVNQNSEDGFR
jgi:hypothetical protein